MRVHSQDVFGEIQMNHVENQRRDRGIFTLIELLMKYTCQPCNYVLYYKRE